MISTTWIRAIIVSLLVVLVAEMTQAQSIENASSSDAKQAVLARLAEIQEAAKALDPDKVFSFVRENDRGELIQNGKLYLTREAALQSTKRGFQRLEQVDYQFDHQHVTMLAPNVALAVGEGLSTATTSNGRTIRMRFAQSVVLTFQDGEWKVFHAHRSFPPTDK